MSIFTAPEIILKQNLKIPPKEPSKDVFYEQISENFRSIGAKLSNKDAFP